MLTPIYGLYGYKYVCVYTVYLWYISWSCVIIKNVFTWCFFLKLFGFGGVFNLKAKQQLVDIFLKMLK